MNKSVKVRNLKNQAILFLWDRRLYLLTTLSVVLVLVIYIFFISVGTWKKWPPTTNNYDQLAKAFNSGSLSLLTQPDPSILALQNPYQYDAARKQATYPWDVSLYKGKYYLYWGPAPAILLTIVERFRPIKVGDQYIVFAATCGLFLVSILLLLRLWNQFFSDLPLWAFQVVILFVGLVSPILWDLNAPEIYEASIVFGQFLLLGGLYFAYLSFDKPHLATWKLVLAGICWAAAIATRITLILPILFWIVTTTILMMNAGQKKARVLWTYLPTMMLPLLVSLLGLGWYNWARFNSPFEFGIRYQLTSSDLNKTQLFSLGYLPSNLFSYIFWRFKLGSTFPFLISDGLKPISFFLNFAPNVIAEQTTGILYSSPFMIFALISLISVIKGALQKRRSEQNDPQSEGTARSLLLWTCLSLTGSIVLMFSTILLYFYQTMRFLADVTPHLALLSGIGFWQGLNYFKGRQNKFYPAYKYAAILFVIASCVISFLLAISSYHYERRFVRFNPALLEAMIHFWGG